MSQLLSEEPWDERLTPYEHFQLARARSQGAFNLLERLYQFYEHEFAFNGVSNPLDAVGRYGAVPVIVNQWRIDFENHEAIIASYARDDTQYAVPAGFIFASKSDRSVLTQSRNVWTVDQLWVHPSYRRFGLGRALVEAAIRRHPGIWEVFSYHQIDPFTFWNVVTKGWNPIVTFPKTGPYGAGVVYQFRVPGVDYGPQSSDPAQLSFPVHDLSPNIGDQGDTEHDAGVPEGTG